jgi:hypothetical protein
MVQLLSFLTPVANIAVIPLVGKLLVFGPAVSYTAINILGVSCVRLTKMTVKIAWSCGIFVQNMYSVIVLD